MRVHLDVLGWLFAIVGATGALTGVAVALLAVGTAFGAPSGQPGSIGWSHPVPVLFAVAAVVFLGAGLTMTAIGLALGRRRPGARAAALVAGALNLCLLPFGTALGIYAFWVLINDEARREFGRPPRGSVPLA